MKNLTKWNIYHQGILLIFVLTLLSFCTDTRSNGKPLSTSEKSDIDVSFYHIAINLGIDKQELSGKVRCDFKVLTPTNTIFLDLHQSMKVDEITIQNTALNYAQKENKLEITFPNKILPKTLTSIHISYYGSAQTIEQNGIKKGLVYGKHGNNEPVIATLNTPFLSHYWFPCNDNISDKADSVYMDIVIPDTTINNIPLMVLSNGKLNSSLKLSNNKKIFKWRHRHAIAPCYIFFAVSNYRKRSEEILSEFGVVFPIDFYVFNEDYIASLTQMSSITDVFSFFSDKFGKYPYQDEQMAFAQIGFYSGIETQTCPIVENLTHRRFYTMIHELAHSWFANNVTAESWEDAWLHEGFATYAEVLWDEHRFGKNAYQAAILKRAYYEGGKIYGEATTNPFQVFSGIVYNKGAYVLHMLRGVVGDEVFFDILKTYLTKYQGKNASTANFIDICKAKSDSDFDSFFAEWLYQEGFPIYNYTFYQNPKTLEITFTIRQTQIAETNHVFKMPIQLYLDLEYQDTIIVINNDSYNQKHVFRVNQKVSDIILDPNNWILKQVEKKKHIIEINNNSMYDVEFNQSLSGRTIDLILKSSKKHKATFLLQDAYGKIVYEEDLTVAGTSMYKIEIPRNIEGGSHTMIIESKYERFFKELMILD